MAQQNMNDQMVTQCNKHKAEHVAYWKDHNKPTDETKFTEGFNAGWSDAENASVASRDSMINQRKNENVAKCGNSPFIWVFETGYREGFDTRRRLNPGGQADTHDQKMAEMAKHKEGHLAYWKAHGNKQTDPRIFEDGFINGWCDCEAHLSDQNITATSLVGQRRQEHIKTFGDSPCMWAFNDGYREGFDGRKCMKPPQQQAPPPATNPPPAAPPAANPAPPATTQQPPAPTQPPATAQPPQVANCPPANAPPTTTPAPAPPTNTQQPPAPVPAPTQPANPAPPVTNAPGPGHQCTPSCNHGAATTSQPAPPASQPANNHCHTPAADLPADHVCTSGCDHRKKESLVEKMEHALHIKK